MSIENQGISHHEQASLNMGGDLNQKDLNDSIWKNPTQSNQAGLNQSQENAQNSKQELKLPPNLLALIQNSVQ